MEVAPPPEMPRICAQPVVSRGEFALRLSPSLALSGSGSHFFGGYSTCLFWGGGAAAALRPKQIRLIRWPLAAHGQQSYTVPSSQLRLQLRLLLRLLSLKYAAQSAIYLGFLFCPYIYTQSPCLPSKVQCLGLPNGMAM